MFLDILENESCDFSCFVRIYKQASATRDEIFQSPAYVTYQNQTAIVARGDDSLLSTCHPAKPRWGHENLTCTGYASCFWKTRCSGRPQVRILQGNDRDRESVHVTRIFLDSLWGFIRMKRFSVLWFCSTCLLGFSGKELVNFFYTKYYQ